MTLSELLHSVDFDRIAPFIGKYHGSENCMAHYKIHYDILRGTLPQPDEECCLSATVSLYEAGEWDRNLPAGLLEAFPLEGDSWQASLAKELVIDPGVTACDAEIAACCLWHTSFYGFTPEDRQKTFEELSGEPVPRYALEAKRFKALYGELVPSKRQISQVRDFHNELRRRMRGYRHYRLDEEEKKDKDSLSERKRCWRKWKRRLITLRYIDTVSKVGGFIEQMQSGESLILEPDLKLLAGLFMAGRCEIRTFRTYVDDASRRFENFKELILKYGAFRDTGLPNCILSIGSSRDYPVTMEELQLVQFATKGCKEVVFCVKADDGLGKELQIRAAFYEP